MSAFAGFVTSGKIFFSAEKKGKQKERAQESVAHLKGVPHFLQQWRSDLQYCSLPWTLHAAVAAQSIFFGNSAKVCRIPSAQFVHHRIADFLCVNI